MDVQIFGVKNNADVRKAERFFKERRIQTHFVDFKQREPSKGELRRFFDRFGVDHPLDVGGDVTNVVPYLLRRPIDDHADFDVGHDPNPTGPDPPEPADTR